MQRFMSYQQHTGFWTTADFDHEYLWNGSTTEKQKLHNELQKQTEIYFFKNIQQHMPHTQSWNITGQT